MIKPSPAQLAVLIHYDGGPTPQEQGHRPTADTIKTCRQMGWIEASAEEYPRHLRTAAAGVAEIRAVIRDYVSPGTAPRPIVTLAAVVAALRDADPADAKQGALDHLGRIVALRAELERHITEAVAAALQAGANWTEMGAQLGMLRGNAQRKYDPLLKRTVTVKKGRTG